MSTHCEVARLMAVYPYPSIDGNVQVHYKGTSGTEHDREHVFNRNLLMRQGQLSLM